MFLKDSRDARNAEGRVVGREQERVRRRMTGQSPKTGVKIWPMLSHATKVSRDRHAEARAVDVSLLATLARPASTSADSEVVMLERCLSQQRAHSRIFS